MKPYQIEQKTNNLTAHLAVVKGDIDNHIKMLSNLTNEIKIASGQLSDIKKEEQTLNSVIEKQKEFIEALDNREKTLKTHENKLKEREKELDLLVDSEKERLEEEKRELRACIKVLNDDLNASTVNFERLRGTYSGTLEALKSEIETLMERRTSCRQDYLEAEERILNANEELQSLERKLIKEGDKLVKLQTEVENYGVDNKIAEIKLSLENRETELAQRERNYLILKGRLGKVLTRLYPEQNIDNLI